MSAEIIFIFIGLINGLIVGFIELRKMRTKLDTMKVQNQSENDSRDDAWRDLLAQNDTNWQEFARRQLEASEKEIKRLGRTYENAVSELTALREVHAEVDTRSRDRGERIEQLLTKLEQTRQDLLKTTETSARRDGELTTEINQLKRQNSSLEMALNKLQRELSTVLEQNRDLRIDRDNKDIENRRLLDDLSASSSREAALIERINTLEARVNELVQENTALNQRIEDLNRKWEEREHSEQNNGNTQLYDRPASPGGDYPDNDDSTGHTAAYGDSAAA